MLSFSLIFFGRKDIVWWMAQILYLQVCFWYFQCIIIASLEFWQIVLFFIWQQYCCLVDVLSDKTTQRWIYHNFSSIFLPIRSYSADPTSKQVPYGRLKWPPNTSPAFSNLWQSLSYQPNFNWLSCLSKSVSY